MVDTGIGTYWTSTAPSMDSNGGVEYDAFRHETWEPELEEWTCAYCNNLNVDKEQCRGCGHTKRGEDQVVGPTGIESEEAIGED